MFWTSKQQTINQSINNIECPITLTPIRDLVNKDPSNVVVFHASKRLRYAYDKRALMSWFCQCRKKQLLQRPESDLIILIDPLCQVSLGPLRLRNFNSSIWSRVDERIIDDFKFLSTVFFPVLSLLVMYGILKTLSGDQQVGSRNDARLVSVGLLIGVNYALISLTHRYAVPRLREVTRKHAEQQFERNFNAWFDENYVPFDQARHQFSDELASVDAPGELGVENLLGHKI